MAVTTSNLYSESRTVLKNHLNDVIVDSRRGKTNSNRRWIFRFQDDTTSRDFEQYPVIILESPDFSDDLQSLNSGLSDGTLQFTIIVQTEFTDKDARLDDLSSQVYAAFRLRKNIDALACKNLYEPEITDSVFELVEQDGKELATRTFTILLRATLDGDNDA